MYPRILAAAAPTRRGATYMSGRYVCCRLKTEGLTFRVRVYRAASSLSSMLSVTFGSQWLHACVFYLFRPFKVLMLYLHRSLSDFLLYSSIPTVGFNMKRVQKGHVTLKCWDIGGQPRFRTMWERYCRGVNAIVYVCPSQRYRESVYADVRGPASSSTRQTGRRCRSQRRSCSCCWRSRRWRASRCSCWGTSPTSKTSCRSTS